jgi:hypothetical protein
VGSPNPTFRGDLLSSSSRVEMSKIFLDVCFLEMSGSKYTLTQRHIPEQPISQTGIRFVRRNALHSEKSVLGAVLRESSSVSQPAGSKHSVFISDIQRTVHRDIFL